MALQGDCDCCHETWDEREIIYITRYDQNLCPVCINEVINSLESADER